jgi:fumarylpyruvate hydrolase
MYVFPPPALPALAVQGTTSTFPLQRIYCVGRNYAEHAKEMGATPDRGARPMLFLKPANSLLLGNVLSYPPATNDLHHEVELVVALHAGGRNLSAEAAAAAIFGYAVGCDLTRRDLQAELKKAGWPWDIAKSFEGAAVIGRLTQTPPAPNAAITLSVNGAERQRGQLSDMLWSTVELIQEVSRLFTLQAGDVLFTGTPSGVGPMVAGDRLRAEIDGLDALEFQVLSGG